MVVSERQHHPAQKSFRTLLLLVNLTVSTMMSVIVEERNALVLGYHPDLLPNLGFFAKIFIKEMFIVLLPLLGLSMSLKCIFLPKLTFALPH